MFDRNTCNYRTVCKLFTLDRNTWYHIRVCQKSMKNELYNECKYERIWTLLLKHLA